MMKIIIIKTNNKKYYRRIRNRDHQNKNNHYWNKNNHY